MQHPLLRFWSTLFPASCVGCNAHGSALCQNCCARIPLSPDTEDPRVYALYDYGNRFVEQAVRNLKYHRKSEVARALMKYGTPHVAEFISTTLQSEHPEAIVFIPIPQHRKKSVERGFSQSELLASIIAGEFKGSRVSRLLRKHRFTLPQAQIKQKSLRLTNLKSSMEAIRPLDPLALFILVDDVTTTGATFTEATRALQAAGAKKILCIALAHGYAKRK